MKVTLELTAAQAYTMMEALEFFSRVHMGQFDNITYTLHMDTFDKTMNRPDFDRKKAQEYLDQARTVIFPQLSLNASWGIMQTNERSKISWDIYQQIRHDISRFKYPNEPFESGRCSNKPFVVSKEPLPKITITED
jgi:hypothetical protein